MRSFRLGAILPILGLAAAAPDQAPHITGLTFSGSGCPNKAGSVQTSTSVLGDSASFTFTLLSGATTDNCEVHVQSSGGSPGWQVAVQSVAYSGNVSLQGGSELDTYTTVFWSENAGATSVLKGSYVSGSSSTKGYVTINSSTSNYVWSECTEDDGSPGILNVNFRPVIQGYGGSYDITSGTWNLIWRRC